MGKGWQSLEKWGKGEANWNPSLSKDTLLKYRGTGEWQKKRSGQIW